PPVTAHHNGGSADPPEPARWPTDPVHGVSRRCGRPGPEEPGHGGGRLREQRGRPCPPGARAGAPLRRVRGRGGDRWGGGPARLTAAGLPREVGLVASPLRVRRVAEQAKKELGDILRTLKDPRIGFVTVTDVEVSNDLSHLKIFVSVYGDQESRQQSLEGLQAAKGLIRSELGRRIRLRMTPEIEFRLDTSL